MFNTPFENFINKKVKFRENMSLDVSLSGASFIGNREYHW